MSGRRRHERFRPARPWDGQLTVLRDVHVQPEADGHLTALSLAPGVVGEELRLDIASGDRSAALAVRVVESRPVILSGGVRHQVRLQVLRSAAGEAPDAHLA
jgi:hypothetical protein